MMSEPLPSDIVVSDVATGQALPDPFETASRPLRPHPWHARFGLSWSTGSVPVVLILLLGAALGPSGLAILTPAVLTVIDPVLPVAVAALGILAALEFTRPAAPNRWPLLGKASLESILTGVLVIIGMRFVLPAAGFDGVDAGIIAVVLGVCASMSSTLPEHDSHRLRSTIARLRDLDAVLPAVIGALVLASLRTLSPIASLGLTVQATILALLVAATAWLLLADTTTLTEQRVFSIAALLLIGGVADYLSLSALIGGMLAGLLWGYIGGITRDCIERDVGYLRHPLVVLMLLVAGARTRVSVSILILAGACLVLRVVGKLLGAWLTRRLPDVAVAPRASLALLPPGIFGIAFALEATAMMDESSVPILSAIVLASIGSQLFAAIWQPVEMPE
jgi:hypothetical protein